MDKVSREARSRMMSKIKGKDTAPELLVRNYLHKRGFRFRLHYKDLPGKPDVVLKKYKTCIFVNGCFWHQHPGCKRSNVPKSNKDYWVAKLERNIQRQKQSINSLKEMGYKTFILWECEIINPEKLKSIDSIISWQQKN